MAKKTIALDAGHGLKTAGKQTPDGIKEWTLNDKVRDKVVDMLKDYDVEFVFPDNNEGNVDEGLISRRTMYVNQKVDAAVSIHHNAYTGDWNNATGVETYVDNRATTADMKLAKCIQTRLVANTGMKDRGIKKADWTVIFQNAIPAVLVEGGFMDGKNDYPYITSDEGQTAYAKAVAEGLIEFLGLTKKEIKPATPAPAPTNEFPAVPFMVRVIIDDLNYRSEPSMNGKVEGQTGKGSFTIVEVNDGWGRLKSGAGWIYLENPEYCTVVKPATEAPKPAEPPKPESPFPAVPFMVRVIIDDLNIRTAPSMEGKVKGVTKKGSFTIVEVKDGWGRLKSGAGWIYLENPDYCTIIK